jgi:hypothetical protein
MATKPRVNKQSAADVTQSPTGEKPGDSADGSPASPTSSDTQEDSSNSSRDEQIRQAAYRRYQERGAEHGNHEQDWFDAEREIGGDASS